MDVRESTHDARQLCDKCQSIPFKDIQESPKERYKPFNLGTYDELKQKSSCPFCCMVFAGVRDLSHDAGFSDPDLFIEHAWARTYNIEAEWCGHYFDTSITNIELRFTTGPCARLGRVVDPGSIPVKAITSLLKQCDASHQCSLPMSKETSNRMTRLRAIDVHELCITSITPNTRYSALSYVWGGVTVAHLMRDNIEELKRPRGLEAYRDEIPLTIRDAIKFVRTMGLEYLWVDALCLIQDDPEDMAHGTTMMSTIYEHAYITLVAASGLNANSGLPGVSPREVNQITAEVHPEVQLVGVCKTGLLLNELRYSHRAWTFQEFHMSRRKLVFMKDLVQYQCIDSFWSEDREEPPLYPEFQSLMLAPINPDKRIRAFTDLLSQYSTRQATYQDDIVNAMVSVYGKILDKAHGGHFFGVPGAAFDWFMCFYTHTEVADYLERREELPSWAWSGWRGKLSWSTPGSDEEILAWTAEHTWIVWHIVQHPDREPLLIWHAVETNEPIRGGVIEDILLKRMTNLQRFSDDALPILPVRSIPPTTERQCALIQFWTFSATFRLHRDRQGESYLEGLEFAKWKVPLEVLDRDGKYSGYIYVDEDSSRNDHNAAALIAIAEADALISPNYAFIYSPKKASERENGRWYSVLYIVERSGIAERKGFGHVYTDEIRVSPESPWEWKEIILG